MPLLILLVLISFPVFSEVQNLVLLPIDVSEEDFDFEREYGSAFQQSLQDEYTVFYGSVVERQLEKEYEKIDCDSERCSQNLAIAFNGELVADGSVKRADDGYFLNLVIRNVLTGEVIRSYSKACEKCNRFDVVRTLKHIKSEQLSEEPVYKVQAKYNSISSSRAILIFDSKPSGASIKINGKSAGNTPYQGLFHTQGEKLSINLSHARYADVNLDVDLSQPISHLDDIVLVPATGTLLIATKTYSPNAKIHVDGEYLGLAPSEITLGVGKHKIAISAGDRTTGTVVVNVVKGTNPAVQLKLNASRKEGRKIVDVNGVEFELVKIPAGEFLMGSNNGEENEMPVHSVEVETFYLMNTEVTQEQWISVMGSNPSHFDRCGLRCPIESVNWSDVKEFVHRLNRLTQLKFRLPSESEWEYAARANSTTTYSWGDNAPCALAHFGYSSRQCKRSFMPKPVASYIKNSFGLFDMHGNVWEWTQDCWSNSYVNALSKGRARRYGDCTARVLRGGSWFDNSSYITASYRYRYGTADSDTNIGFRLALD